MTTASSDDLPAATEAAVRLGSMLLAAGSGSFRVEQAMRQAATCLGIDRLDLLVGHDNLVVAARRGERVHTVVRQVYDRQTDAGRLETLESLADSLRPGITAARLEARLDVVERRGGVHRSALVRMLCAGVGCGCFALLNNFTIGDALVAGLAAMAGFRVQDRLELRHVNPFGVVALASFTACLLYGALGWAVDATGLPVLRSVSGPGFVAALLFLVPGYPLVTALLELARADFSAGLPRAMEALGKVLAMVLPAWLVSSATGMRPLTGEHLLPAPWRWLALLVVGWVGMACFSALFSSTRRVVVAAASLGAICGLARAVALACGMARPASAALGALAVGLLTAVVAPRLRVPRSTLLVPASLIMMPGALLARTVYWLGVPDLSAAARNGFGAFGTMLAIAVGLSVARMVTDPEWATLRPRPAPHAFQTGGGGSHAA